jgi:hypothetical protein
MTATLPDSIGGDDRPALLLFHTAETGTILSGTDKGDGAYDALCAAGQRWRGLRSGEWAGSLFVPHSRDRPADRPRIRQAERVLTAAGFRVTVDLDGDTPRAEVERRAALVERAEERAEYREELAAKRTRDADAARAASDAISDGIPFGQPILVGHHSERRARRDVARMHAHMGRSRDMAVRAEYHSQRAEAAGATARPDSPVTVANRIDTNEAEVRRIRRTLDGYTRTFKNGRGEVHYTEVHKATGPGEYRDTLESRIEYLQARIDGDRADLAERAANGGLRIFDRTTVRKGGQVKIRGTWRVVKRVNPKTVSVETGYSWTDTVPYQEITDYRD